MMNELATLPASIRQRLEMAQSLADRGRTAEAHGAYSEVLAVLARSSPDLCAVLLATLMGKNGVTSTTVEERHFVQRIEHTFLGILIAEEWVPMTTRTTSTRTIKLF